MHPVADLVRDAPVSAGFTCRGCSPVAGPTRRDRTAPERLCRPATTRLPSVQPGPWNRRSCAEMISALCPEYPCPSRISSMSRVCPADTDRSPWRTTCHRKTAPAVARLRAAGAIIIGKTTTSEFGLRGYTESLVHGVTRNVWDPHSHARGFEWGRRNLGRCWRHARRSRYRWWRLHSGALRAYRAQRNQGPAWPSPDLSRRAPRRRWHMSGPSLAAYPTRLLCCP